MCDCPHRASEWKRWLRFHIRGSQGKESRPRATSSLISKQVSLLRTTSRGRRSTGKAVELMYWRPRQKAPGKVSGLGQGTTEGQGEPHPSPFSLDLRSRRPSLPLWPTASGRHLCGTARSKALWVRRGREAEVVGKGKKILCGDSGVEF